MITPCDITEYCIVGLKTFYSNIKVFIFQLIGILAKMVITFEPVGIFSCGFSMLYSGEQILSFKSCLVFYAGDSLNICKKQLHILNAIRNVSSTFHVFYTHVPYLLSEFIPLCCTKIWLSVQNCITPIGGNHQFSRRKQILVFIIIFMMTMFLCVFGI